MMIDEFAKVGLGDWFRTFTGVVEVIGAIAVLIPRTTPWGALLLLCVDVGAFFAQLLRIHDDVIHTFVVAAFLLVLLWLTRDRLTNPMAS
jgi:hypothetical protein